MKNAYTSRPRCQYCATYTRVGQYVVDGKTVWLCHQDRPKEGK